jgi:NADH-quinone oxidoreductase subunit L
MLVPLGLLTIGAVFVGFAFHHAFIEQESFWNGAISSTST